MTQEQIKSVKEMLGLVAEDAEAAKSLTAAPTALRHKLASIKWLVGEIGMVMLGATAAPLPARRVVEEEVKGSPMTEAEVYEVMSR